MSMSLQMTQEPRSWVPSAQGPNTSQTDSACHFWTADVAWELRLACLEIGRRFLLVDIGLSVPEGLV